LGSTLDYEPYSDKAVIMSGFSRRIVRAALRSRASLRVRRRKMLRKLSMTSSLRSAHCDNRRTSGTLAPTSGRNRYN
jgi:hypothetical protein